MDNAKKMQKRYKESTYGQLRQARSDLKPPSRFGLAPRDFRKRKRGRQDELDSVKALEHSRHAKHLAEMLSDPTNKDMAERFAGGKYADDRSRAMVQGRAGSTYLKDLQEETQAQQAAFEVQMTGDKNHDLKLLKAGMLKGAEEGNHAMGNAAMNMLATRGEPGVEMMSEGLTEIDNNFKSGAWTADSNQGKATLQMKSNLTQSHSKLKGAHADVNKWGKSGLATPDHPENSLEAIRKNKDTYANLTDEELATQKELSLNSDGARAALNETVERVDKDGTPHSMTRKARVASSEAGKEIAGKTGSYFQ